jgi:adenine phosphoribosyltransferase
MTEKKSPVISFKDFSFQYRAQKKPTLTGINLDIYPGEKVLIAGPSGSGKSTLAGCINGLNPFSNPGECKGTLTVDGVDAPHSSIFELSAHVGTVLQDPDGLKLAIDGLKERLDGVDFDVVVGAESRGFIFGAPLAYEFGKGFVPVRKKGKLPCETVCAKYDLEYGSAEIEMHKDSIKPGQKVVVVDDLIATGGTIEAAIKLIESLGGEVVKVLFLMELAGLNGREKLKGYDVESVITYPGN